MRIGLLTGGGDAPGLNAAIRAVVRVADGAGHRTSRVRNGWAGALEGRIEDLTRRDVRGILPLGGTILGTSRTNPLKATGGIERVVHQFRGHGIDALVAIGGDDTLSVARALHEAHYPVVGVPKTIDNDLSATDFCIGFDTAVGIVAEALDRLHTTASSHHRVMVVEVMGRDVGWVATMGGLAGGADMVLIPEFPLDLEDVVTHVRRRWADGKDFSIIVVAEGVHLAGMEAGDGETDAFGHIRLADRGVGDALSRAVEAATGFESRVTVLGHLQRGGTPSTLDRIWSTRLGARAAELIIEGDSGVIPVRHGGEVAVVSLDEVLAQRRVPEQLYDLTRLFG
jgi:6-phosphofructokinase 1